MNTVSKVVNAGVLVGSAVVGYNAIKTSIEGFNSKNYGKLAMGALTVLIAYSAIRYSMEKLND